MSDIPARISQIMPRPHTDTGNVNFKDDSVNEYSSKKAHVPALELAFW